MPLATQIHAAPSTPPSAARSTLRTILGASLLAWGCTSAQNAGPAEGVFLDGQDAGELRGANLREASGISRSGRFSAHYWTHNDSGNDPVLFLLDSTGLALSRVRVAGVRNRDWEDIAIRGDTLYVAETGDNEARWDTVYVYTVVEPTTIGDTTVPTLGRYAMQFPDGPRDVETLLVDPQSGDWFLVSKREEHSRLYRYPWPQRQDATVILERVPGEFPFRLAVAGDVSPDGHEVLIKTYDAVYYWARRGTEPLGATLMRPPERQPYTPERQGEALAFTSDGGAYLTTSEVELDAPQLLLRYPRKPERP